MKKNLLLIALLFVFGSTFAQQQSAQLSDDLSITIPTDAPVKATYKADVKPYASNMTDRQTADQFIKQFERPLVSCKVELNTYVLTITLEMNEETKVWTAERWNEYLKSN